MLLFVIRNVFIHICYYFFSLTVYCAFLGFIELVSGPANSFHNGMAVVFEIHCSKINSFENKSE